MEFKFSVLKIALTVVFILGKGSVTHAGSTCFDFPLNRASEFSTLNNAQPQTHLFNSEKNYLFVLNLLKNCIHTLRTKPHEVLKVDSETIQIGTILGTLLEKSDQLQSVDSEDPTVKKDASNLKIKLESLIALFQKGTTKQNLIEALSDSFPTLHQPCNLNRLTETLQRLNLMLFASEEQLLRSQRASKQNQANVRAYFSQAYPNSRLPSEGDPLENSVKSFHHTMYPLKAVENALDYLDLSPRDGIFPDRVDVNGLREESRTSREATLRKLSGMASSVKPDSLAHKFISLLVSYLSGQVELKNFVPVIDQYILHAAAGNLYAKELISVLSFHKMIEAVNNFELPEINLSKTLLNNQKTQKFYQFSSLDKIEYNRFKKLQQYVEIASSPLATLSDKRNAAWALYKSNKLNEAATWYDKVGRDPEATLNDRRKAGLAILNLKDFSEAATRFAQIVQDPEATLDDKRRLADALFNAKNFTESVTWASQIAQLPGATLDDKRMAAAAFFKLKKFTDSATWYSQVARDPNATLDDKRYAGFNSFKTKNFTDAETWLAEVARDPNATLDDKRRAARALFGTNNFGESAAWYVQVAQDPSATLDDKRNTGLAFFKSSNFTESAAWYVQVARGLDATLNDKRQAAHAFFKFNHFTESAYWISKITDYPDEFRLSHSEEVSNFLKNNNFKDAINLADRTLENRVNPTPGKKRSASEAGFETGNCTDPKKKQK